MTKTIENLFSLLAHYSDLLPILFFLFFWKKSKPIRILWIVFIYSIYDFLTNFGLLYLRHKPTRVFLYSTYTFIEYSLFTTAFYLMINNKGFKKSMLVLSILFTAFIIPYNILFRLRGIDSIPIGVETILMLIFSFYYLYEQMKDVENLFVYSKFSFWIVLGMMIYLAGSFFIYIYASQLPNNKTIARYWIFTNIFSILKNIFFTIAIIINAKGSEKTKKKINGL